MPKTTRSARRISPAAAMAELARPEPAPWTLESGAKELLRDLARDARTTMRDAEHERERAAGRFARFGAELAQGWVPLGMAPNDRDLELAVARARSAKEALYAAASMLDPDGLRVVRALEDAFLAAAGRPARR